MTPEGKTVLEWIATNREELSRDHAGIWALHEPAWREYRASQWYVDRLRREGFEVEAGGAGMPTSFTASWVSPAGDGPHIAAYAEYDAVPGNSQDNVPFEKPRPGMSRWAPGFTEPHSAVGIASFGGLLAAKAAMERHGIKGTLRYFGEPAENMCGGKVFHAAKGYYDGLDAVIAWRTSPLPATVNTCALDTLCGCFWSKVYTFEHKEVYGAPVRAAAGSAGPPGAARSSGALDAMCLMYTTSKYLREAMLPHAGSWALNEAILANGSATADNAPPRIAQLQYSWRCPTVEMAQRILDVLDSNADYVARVTNTSWRSDWVSRTRPGLPNHALAEIAYANFEKAGPPSWEDDAREFARSCQRSLSIEPMVEPFADGLDRLIPPEIAEAAVRADLPAWQKHFGSDDYVEYTWHAPTVRILVARPRLAPPEPGYVYPRWVTAAMGGVPEIVDPVMLTASRVIGLTIVDLLTSPDKLARCKSEFDERTQGGIRGKGWIAPLLGPEIDPPVDFPWPEYVTTARGHGWCIPVNGEAGHLTGKE